MKTSETGYDEMYALLMHLCEQQLALTDAAALCVMEAFNRFTELHTPDRLITPQERAAVEALLHALELLDQLLTRSRRLVDTLGLTEVQGLLGQALDAER